MLHGKLLTVLLIIVVFLNPSQTASGKISRTQVEQDEKLEFETAGASGQDGDIHLKTWNRQVRDDNEEREDSSGNGGERRVEIRDIHYQMHNRDQVQHTLDKKENKVESSGNNNLRGKVHFRNWKKERGDEFGFITKEDEAGFPEDIAEGAVSGARGNNHNLREHRGEQHVIKPRDYTEDGEDDDEISGDKDGKNATRKYHLHLSYHPKIGDKKPKTRKVNLPTEEQRIGSESGEEERLSGVGEEMVPEENDKEVNVIQNKEQNRPFGSKSVKNKKKAVTHVDKDHKQLKMRQDKEKIGTKKHLQGEDDFYIEENDEPKEKLYVVEMQDFDDGKDSEEREKRQTDALTSDTETIQRFRKGPYRHLLQFHSEEVIPTDGHIPVSSTQCSHPAVPDKIADDTIIYIRAECRLCHCKMGELICALKPQFCDHHRTNRSCSMERGEVANGRRHFDGCNRCLCRNGELLCTRVRCPSANYNYINYPRSANDIQETPSNASALNRNMRGKDPCMECDYDPILPVCGPNWKTYRSMCHALHCGGLRIEDVKQGSCEIMNPCDDAKCPEHEICVAKKRGPCLTSTTTDRDIVECPQYQCVDPTKDCNLDLVGEVCGEDHKTYESECTLSGRGISLAYYGPCKGECFVDDTRMCGADGVTFTSSCHTNRLNSHVDYPGECDQVDPSNNVPMKIKDPTAYINRRCKTVQELARCPEIACSKHVIPEGSCCRACGTAISIRLDIAAKDMATLDTAEDKPYHQLNRLGLIQNTLKSLVTFFLNGDRCQLTTDLVDTNDISVVYSSIKPEDLDACEQVARKTVDFINSPAKNDLEPGQALLAAAVVVEQSEMNFVLTNESVVTVMAKRRSKRTNHHKHEPMFDHSVQICPIDTFLLFLVALVLNWTTNLAKN